MVRRFAYPELCCLELKLLVGSPKPDMSKDMVRQNVVPPGCGLWGRLVTSRHKKIYMNASQMVEWVKSEQGLA
jgi:hypothetical protein